MVRLAINLPKIADRVSVGVPILTIASAAAGAFINPWWHIGTAVFGGLTLINFYFKHVQKQHAILANFGLLGSMRYMMESIGPEMRQYFYANDNEERPFDRSERSEVYRKAKNVDSTSSFGTLLDYGAHERKVRHSFFPSTKIEPYSLTFGEQRGIANTFTIDKPFMISAMSYGSLGERAVRSLARGAKKAGIPYNTGEGGYPKYPLEEKPNIIFQMGTAKFGCRNDDSSLNEEKLKDIANHSQIKMIEIKLSQGAKPGKGGLLPKEKITEEIAALRGVSMGEDVISPPRHIECDNVENTVKFIRRVQDVSQLPVGIKFCLGHPDEFTELVKEMKKQDIFPDYIDVDGAEGGTGAAPRSFMDNVGMPLFVALDTVQKTLKAQGVRDKLHLVCSGKLISPGKQIAAMAHGADAVYSARGFMLAIGCIQALQCNKGTCPVGITTHDKKLQHGLNIEDKAQRVANYVKNLDHDFYELLKATGASSAKDLCRNMIYEGDEHTQQNI